MWWYMLWRDGLFVNKRTTTEIYTDGHTLSLHDALPLYGTERHGALLHAVPTGDGVDHVTGTAADGSYSLDMLAEGDELDVWVTHPAHPAKLAEIGRAHV